MKPLSEIARRARWCSSVVALSLGTASSLAAQPQSRDTVALSLRDAIELALANNPGWLSLRNDPALADAAVRASRMDLLVPTASVNTNFGYTAPGQRRAGSVILAEQPTIYSSSYSLSIGYSLSFARLAQSGIAQSERRAALARRTGSEWQLRNDVTQAYIGMLRAQFALAQATREVERIDATAKLTRVRAELGAISTLELKRFEVIVAQVAVRRLQAANDLSSARLSLERQLGVTLPSAVRLTTEFALAMPRWNVDTLVALAHRNSPALLAARASRDVSNGRATSARSAYLPTLSLNVGVSGWAQRTGSFDDAVSRRSASIKDSATIARVRREVEAEYRGFPFNYARQPLGATISIAVPILQGGSRELQAAQARATAADATYTVRAEERRIESDVRAAVLALEGAYETAVLQRIVRTRAEEELRLAQDRVRFGAAPVTAVLDAQAQLVQAEAEDLAFAIAYHKQITMLEHLVGQRLP